MIIILSIKYTSKARSQKKKIENYLYYSKKRIMEYYFYKIFEYTFGISLCLHAFIRTIFHKHSIIYSKFFQKVFSQVRYFSNMNCVLTENQVYLIISGTQVIEEFFDLYAEKHVFLCVENIRLNVLDDEEELCSLSFISVTVIDEILMKATLLLIFIILAHT